ncbi:MAG TPA: J domain-containing protein [Vicinamibacterales bacterium]|nr:J domain-containing protein [Vicinamibacterales bacterium]
MDFYLLLGVERESTAADIKRAYKRLARKYHPDINPGDSIAERHFRQIAEAYETLIDPDRRRRYDTAGGATVGVEAVTFGFDGFDFSVQVSGESAPTFGDLFADVLRHRAGEPMPGAERGADLHVPVRLSFDEAMRGGDRQLSVTRLVHCRGCLGTGHVQMPERRCQHCHGSGVLKSTRNHMVFSKPCSACGGTGIIAHSRCPDCHGRQFERVAEPVTVHLPPGLHDAARIRVSGKGHDGANGGEAGDLYIAVQVDPHPRFRRDGDDLHLTLPVAIHEAALGAKIEVPSFDGTARVRVPPGTQSGQRFRLSERGAPSPRDGRRGDLVIEVRLVLPALLDERSKELLREFGRINNADVRQELT